MAATRLFTITAILLLTAGFARIAAGQERQTPGTAAEPTDETTTLQQPATSDQSPRLNETVEVTATRGSADIETSPASTTVITREQFEDRNLRTVDQALTLTEGVAVYRSKGVQDTEVGIGMRGFSGRGTGQSRVLVLLDGEPINNSYTGAVYWASLPLGEVERVEVVRGPFSALYGGNAMGGVVNVITRPVTGRSVEVAAQGGSQTTGGGSARYGDRFFNRLGITVGYSYLRTGGYAVQEVLRPATDSSPAGGIPVVGVTRTATPSGGVTYQVGMRGNNWYDQYGIRARADYTVGTRTFAAAQYIRQASEYGWDPYRTQIRTAVGGRAVDSGGVVFRMERLEADHVDAKPVPRLTRWPAGEHLSRPAAARDHRPWTGAAAVRRLSGAARLVLDCRYDRHRRRGGRLVRAAAQPRSLRERPVVAQRRPSVAGARR